MKVLALQGSPRTAGNTQALLDAVLQAARDAGATVDLIQLSMLGNITGCRECYACQQTQDAPACAVDDDLQPVLDLALNADLVVWATPAFCWSPSWLLKMAMDRMFCMFKFQDDGTVNCLIKDRKVAAVVTAGGGENDGADLVVETCRRLAHYGKAQWLGALVAANVQNADAIRADADLMKRAADFGRQLAAG